MMWTALSILGAFLGGFILGGFRGMKVERMRIAEARTWRWAINAPDKLFKLCAKARRGPEAVMKAVKVVFARDLLRFCQYYEKVLGRYV